MFRIAICDDVKEVCSSIENILTSFAKENALSIQTSVFYSGESLLRYLKSGNCFELIFLDIEMGQISGVDIGKELRETLGNMDTEIVFVSGTTQYDRALFSFQPLLFIAKPFAYNQISDSLTLAIKRRQMRKPSFAFTYNQQTHSIKYEDILYFESEGRKILIFTSSGTFCYYGKISDIPETLPGFFCQVHRSYIVNIHKIIKFTAHSVTMSGGEIITVSDSFRQSFLQHQHKEFVEESLL